MRMLRLPRGVLPLLCVLLGERFMLRFMPGAGVQHSTTG